MFKFYCHAGSGNHGCEAIVRASQKILDTDVVLFSKSLNQDKKYGLDKICEIESDTQVRLTRKSMKWFISAIQEKVTGKIDLTIRYSRDKLLKHIFCNDICFSIGGDNYCYPGTEILNALNKNIKRKGAKTVLWGCSVEPDALSDNIVARDIASFDLITARETISYNSLRKVNKNTVLVSDPAFVLDKIDLPLPDGWIEGKMVGINASPLIMQSAKSEKIAMDAYIELIRYIIDNTPYHIALIPHVVCDNNDDRVPLNKLYQMFKDTNRVVLIEDHNCMELKGYISRCKFFVGARTHATIAAYSTCVPTLVLGYSVKSLGIAKDLFGTSDNYVLPVQELSESYGLTNGFVWLMDNEEFIRNHLMSIMPDYKRRAYLSKDAVNKLI